jgi:hypothetical protein
MGKKQRILPKIIVSKIWNKNRRHQHDKVHYVP